MTDDQIYEKTDDIIYELTENKSYSKVQRSTLGTAASSTTGYLPSNQSKWFRVIVVLAILNFLLIIGVGAALAYYQAKMASEIAEISQEINQGLTSGLFDGSISGPPGPQGITLCSIHSQLLYP